MQEGFIRVLLNEKHKLGIAVGVVGDVQPSGENLVLIVGRRPWKQEGYISLLWVL